MKNWLSRALFVSCALAAVLLAAPRACHAQVIPEEDPRLARVASLDPSRSKLGELLGRLSAESGIPLETDEDQEASGTDLFVSLRGARTDAVMHAVSSFFSRQGALSHWQRSGGGPSDHRYRLVVSPRGHRDPMDEAYWAGRLRNLFDEIAKHSGASDAELEGFRDDKPLYA